jgi:ABC-type Mn2+/Zn2+ transport system ATPase subunit
MRHSQVRPPEHDPSAPALVADRLTVAYDGVIALRQVSFQLPAGRRLAVVGPNGAGKTSLFNVIAGVLRPAEGSVRIFGHLPGGDTCIAYVPQRSQVDWGFPATAGEVVMMGRIREIGPLRWPRRADWESVRTSLDRVGMAEAAGRSIGDLSGGQQQRVLLAQALAQEAEIVLLDEPFTALDLPSQEALLTILDGLQRGGVTVLVSTHDLNLAAGHFDSVMLLNRRLIALGPPPEVLRRDNLVQAYGGHVHILAAEQDLLVLTDTCCEGDEAEP